MDCVEEEARVRYGKWDCFVRGDSMRAIGLGQLCADGCAVFCFQPVETVVACGGCASSCAVYRAHNDGQGGGMGVDGTWKRVSRGAVGILLAGFLAREPDLAV